MDTVHSDTADLNPVPRGSSSPFPILSLYLLSPIGKAVVPNSIHVLICSVLQYAQNSLGIAIQVLPYFEQYTC